MGNGVSGLKETKSGYRFNELLPSPAETNYKLCVVQFKVPGAKNGGSDKGPDGNRIDSIPIANGVIAAGGACDLVLFDSDKNTKDVKEFKFNKTRRGSKAGLDEVKPFLLIAVMILFFSACPPHALCRRMPHAVCRTPYVAHRTPHN